MLVAGASAGGCTVDGCTGITDIPGGFPPDERVSGLVQVRLSQPGIAALTDNAAEIMTGLLGELVFAIPPVCTGDNLVCCTEEGVPISPCGPVELDLDPRPDDPPRLEILPRQDQSRTDLIVRARVRTLAPVPVVVDAVVGNINCEASIDTEESSPDSVRAEATVLLVQNAETETTELDISDIAIEDLNSGDIDIDGGFLCEVADLLSFLFTGSLVDTLEDAAQDALTTQVCKPCPSGDVDTCGPFADACSDGICTRGDSCLQELGLSGRLLAQPLLGDISPGISGAMDLYEVAGGY
ncbi:MAG: hypothetical protein AAGC55_19250, partial [Myxococcota bacterium]